MDPPLHYSITPSPGPRSMAQTEDLPSTLTQALPPGTAPLTAPRRGVTFRTSRISEIGFDLDRPSDLATVAASSRPTRTSEVCLELGVAGRLGVVA